jgi:DnaJ-class molecular chaperone
MVMEDYYRLLEINYESSINDINNAFKNKIIEFKALPFLTENDKLKFKEIKKANVVLNNKEYKKIYDNHLNNKFKNQIVNNNDTRATKKNVQNQNYLVDRIFSFTSTQNYNLKHNELLRPKNVGLSADDLPDFDKPLDYDESNDFKPYNFDS